MRTITICLVVLSFIAAGLLEAPDGTKPPSSAKGQFTLATRTNSFTSRESQIVTATPKPEPAPVPSATPIPEISRPPKSVPTAIRTQTPTPVPNLDHESLMAAAGIQASDYGYVEYIVAHEDGTWEPCRMNGGTIDCGYTGDRSYGVCQAAPGRKMASAGADWQTNVATQLKWCNSYAKQRYGSWKAAYDYWISHHNW